MKRKTVFPGAVPLETDLLGTNVNVMVALGHVLQDMLGTSTLFSGLGCVPTAPAGMTVNVNPGRAYSYQATDAGAYSSLNADAHQIVKQGILLDAVNFSCPAPLTAGFSINYLVQGAFEEVDTDAQVLPFYNASNPAQAYSGPNNTGASSYTSRDNTVQLALKAGVAATTGSQITPTPDAGFNGLWVITVPYGATTITSGNISPYTGAPFLVAPLLGQIQSAPNGVVGQTRNMSMTVAAASASASVTADEILVESALGGQIFKLSAFSKEINLATTGAGGMDTGSAQASSFVGIYAIYNPTTGAAALLGQSANGVRLPEVYGGANMPAGYTASALLCVVPTNASSQISICSVVGRRTSIVTNQILSTATLAATPTIINNLAVPANAVRCSGQLQIGNSGVSSTNLAVYGNIGGTDAKLLASSLNASSVAAPFENLTMAVRQRMYYTGTNSGGTPTFTISITAWEI